VKAVAARMEGDLEGDGGIELTGQIFRIPLSEVQFTEMREGTKRKDGRINSQFYRKVQRGDTLQYHSKSISADERGTQALVDMVVVRRVEYPTFWAMLTSEGVSNLLSGYTDVDDGVKFYHGIKGFREKELRFRVVCFHLTPRQARKTLAVAAEEVPAHRKTGPGGCGDLRDTDLTPVVTRRVRQRGNGGGSGEEMCQ